MKKLLFTISVLFCSLSLFAAAPTAAQLAAESLNAYRNALYCFDSMDYGKALKYSEDAILFRRQQVEKEMQILKDSLSAKRVRDAGDHIYAVLDVLEDRKEKESLRIINTYLKKKGSDYFDNSITNLREYMKSMIHYPEAHKLIGDIYRLEGEYKFAEDYYLLALSNANVLDVPDEKYEILYMLAEISRLENDLPKMEVRLLNILTDDGTYKDRALNSAMIHTISTNKNDSVEKFFSLYRADTFYSMSAYTKLADYYYDAGAKDKALQFTALAVICGFSKISESIESRNSNYEYTNLANFFQELSFYDDIVKWGDRNLLWKNFNFLARISEESGYDVFARNLLTVLVRWSPEKYWQKEAVLLLQEMGL
ncbi:MAG: hypothetical protein IJ688_10095 [Treponema sp.]|nr:hypothetical protein [Treponema sp.]